MKTWPILRIKTSFIKKRKMTHKRKDLDISKPQLVRKKISSIQQSVEFSEKFYACAKMGFFISLGVTACIFCAIERHFKGTIGFFNQS